MQRWVPVLFCLTGCVAANPDQIPALSISTVGYENLDCARLASEDRRVASELGPQIYLQEKRRNGDVAGVVLIGISRTGMGEPEYAASIARLKGERDTIAAVKATRGCSDPQAPLDTSWQTARAWEKANSAVPR